MSDRNARRSLLRRMGGMAAGAAAFLALAPRVRAQRDGGNIAQPTVPVPAAFMARAAALRDAAVAAGDQSYGAVLVKDGRIAGEGPSRVVQDTDPTAHAEMTAIRDAARRLRTRNLGGATLYATSAPCAMCETAAYFAGVSRIVVGDALEDHGAPRYGGR